MNLKIHASKNNVTEIDIFGDIGQSWFSEGNTMGSVRAALKDVEGDLLINVSSLGGDAAEGLAMHDIIKSHKGKVTTKVIGATASAGTFVALAGSDIQMSENALFLVHNAHTFAQGNAAEMRKVAEGLDKFDARQINLYTTKTGKSEDEVKSLMAEEKWIDATEAKEFGFVDSIFVPQSAAASMKVDASKLAKAGLPQIPETLINKINTMSAEKSKLAKILAVINNTDAPQADEKDDKITELEAANAELQTKLDEANAKIAELEGAAGESTQEADEAAAVIETLQASVKSLNTELAKAKAVGTPLASVVDPNADGKKAPVTEGEKVLRNILSGATSIEKEIHAKK
jgi:ATP-dependent Clp protease protease subunit